MRTYWLKHSTTHSPQTENGVLMPCFNSRVWLWLWWFLIRFSQLYTMLFGSCGPAGLAIPDSALLSLLNIHCLHV